MYLRIKRSFAGKGKSKRILPQEKKMNSFLKVYQIFFNLKQHMQLFADTSCDYIPFFNENCTVFFENDVIRTLIEENKHLDAEYFGVVSYKLKEKLGYTMKEKWKNMPNIANHSTNEFTPLLFETELKKHKPDVMSFQRHQPHDPIQVADRFHPNFINFWSYIMHKIGYDWQPTRFSDVFYCNYFVAKPDIYEKYVKEMLIPAMEVMKEIPELMQNSNYPHKLPSNLAEKFGVTHYPYHTFICERMFSYWVHLNKYKVLHY